MSQTAEAARFDRVTQIFEQRNIRLDMLEDVYHHDRLDAGVGCLAHPFGRVLIHGFDPRGRSETAFELGVGPGSRLYQHQSLGRGDQQLGEISGTRPDFDDISAEVRAEMVRAWMRTENIPGTVLIIPDIEGVYYGRKVGYAVDMVDVTEEMKTISGTDIRKRIKSGDDSWRDMVAPGVADFIDRNRLFRDDAE